MRREGATRTRRRAAASGSLLVVSALLAAGCAPQRPSAPPGAPASATLRVCADPDNLPFTDESGHGFENVLAELLAREIGRRVEYVWATRGPSWLQDTLVAGACDVAPGVPAITDAAPVTAPYYRSTYFFVRRADTPRSTTATASPGARRLRVGLQMVTEDFANTPPAHAVAQRGVLDEQHGYLVHGDDRRVGSPARVIRSLVRGEVDLAIVWGPVAGYFAVRQPTRFDLLQVEAGTSLPSPPLVVDVAIAVRPDDPALRDRLDAALARQRPEIDRLLAVYGVPRLDVPVLGELLVPEGDAPR